MMRRRMMRRKVVIRKMVIRKMVTRPTMRKRDGDEEETENDGAGEKK